MSVEERVKGIISEVLGIDESEITRETRFIEDLGAESLDIVEMIAPMEEGFNIEISDEEAEKNVEVGQGIDYINEEINTEILNPKQIELFWCSVHILPTRGRSI